MVGEDCCAGDNKLRDITATYTGDGCDATVHAQDPNKVSCDGDPRGEPSVHIRATEKKSPSDTGGKIWFEGDVALGSQFVIDSATAGETKLKSNTYVHVFDLGGVLLQTIRFHTSCSQPLFVGDQFGSILIDACTPEGGPVEGQFCAGGAKPKSLVMQYTGAGCSATQHSQDPGKVFCEGDVNFEPIVRIRASDKADPNDGNARVWHDDLVVLAQNFGIDATNAGKTKLKSSTWVHVFDLSGVLLQTVQFHTSCSQPLNEGDRFGGLTLLDFIAE